MDSIKLQEASIRGYEHIKIRKFKSDFPFGKGLKIYWQKMRLSPPET